MVNLKKLHGKPNILKQETTSATERSQFHKKRVFYDLIHGLLKIPEFHLLQRLLTPNNRKYFITYHLYLPNHDKQSLFVSLNASSFFLDKEELNWQHFEEAVGHKNAKHYMPISNIIVLTPSHAHF